MIVSVYANLFEKFFCSICTTDNSTLQTDLNLHEFPSQLGNISMMIKIIKGHINMQHSNNANILSVSR